MIDTFSELPLEPSLRRCVQALPFTTLTAIQKKCIPPLLEGLDVVGQAKTGSGKTLAFLVPAINGLLRARRDGRTKEAGTFAIVLAPTKELAVQIDDVLQGLVGSLGVTSTVVTGGVKLKRERAVLQGGVDIVVGTPGRLWDHVQHAHDWLHSDVRCVIIDEADRLVDKSFQEEVDGILGYLSPERQTMLFSATISSAVQELRRIAFGSTRPPLFIADDEAAAREQQERHEREQALKFIVEGGAIGHTKTRVQQLQQELGLVEGGKKRKRTEGQQEPSAKRMKVWKDGQGDLYDDSDDDGDQKSKRNRAARAPLPTGRTMDTNLLELEEQVKKLAGKKKKKKRVVEEQSDDEDDSGDDEDDRPPVDAVDAGLGSAPTPVRQKLRQEWVECEWEHRLMLLFCFLKFLFKRPRSRKVIVFFSTRASVKYHQLVLEALGIGPQLTSGSVLTLAGNMKVKQRIAAFRSFTSADRGVLLATDVAARGLDIPDVDWIVQFDPPTDIRQYIHRVGRTARAGATGRSLIFLSPPEMGFVQYLQKQNIIITEYETSFDVPNMQLELEKLVMADRRLQSSAQAAFRAFVMAYQDHELRNVFAIKQLDLEAVAVSFALDSIPAVTVRNTDEKPAYVKGVIKSMMRKKMREQAYEQSSKASQQWTKEGKYVGRQTLRRIGTKPLPM